MLTPFDRPQPGHSGGTPSAPRNPGPLVRAILAVLASGTVLTLSLVEDDAHAILAQRPAAISLA